MDTKLDPRYSSDGASPEAWEAGRDVIEQAEIFWLTTVRPDGRPHVTPLISVWLDDAAYFCTGADERKALNLAENPRCALTTGCNALHEGLDVVIEGEAVRITDEEQLHRVAALYEAKYGAEWHFDVRDGGFGVQGETLGLVFRVTSSRVLGFGKGGEYSQTRWQPADG